MPLFQANTNAVIYTDTVMSHYEGGWPKEVDFTEAEHVIRYRKKVEKDEEYINTVVSLGASIEELIKQNNSIDIYEEYWGGQVADHSNEPPSAKTITVFRDPNPIARGVSYISWHPDSTLGKVVVSYSILEFQQQPENMCKHSYVWDLQNPNSPEFELHPISQVCVAHFNNKDSNIIGAGQYNGQLAIFDIRKGNRPTAVTQIENSHRSAFPFLSSVGRPLMQSWPHARLLLTWTPPFVPRPVACPASACPAVSFRQSRAVRSNSPPAPAHHGTPVEIATWL